MSPLWSPPLPEEVLEGGLSISSFESLEGLLWTISLVICLEGSQILPGNEPARASEYLSSHLLLVLRAGGGRELAFSVSTFTCWGGGMCNVQEQIPSHSNHFLHFMDNQVKFKNKIDETSLTIVDISF